jgi:hypothetical protein
METAVNRKLILTFTIFIIAGLSGCVRYYKSSDVRGRFNRVIKQSNNSIAKADGDYNTKKEVYNSIVPHVQRNRQPYPLLQNHLDNMKKSLDKMKNRRNIFKKQKKEFNGFAGRRKKIQSNNPAWKKFHALNKRFENDVKIFGKESMEYSAASKAFSSTAKKNRITKINSAKISGEIDRFNREVVKVLSGVRKNIKKAYANLQDLEASGYDKKVISEKRGLLVLMEDLMKQIKAKNREMTNVSEDFKKEAGGKGEFWAGPGMTSHKILIDLTAKGNEIKGLGNRFTALVDSFNKEQKKK